MKIFLKCSPFNSIRSRCVLYSPSAIWKIWTFHGNIFGLLVLFSEVFMKLLCFKNVYFCGDGDETQGLSLSQIRPSFPSFLCPECSCLSDPHREHHCSTEPILSSYVTVTFLIPTLLRILDTFVLLYFFFLKSIYPLLIYRVIYLFAFIIIIF